MSFSILLAVVVCIAVLGAGLAVAFESVQTLRPIIISLSWLLWIAVSMLNISLQWLLVMWTSMRILLSLIFFALLKTLIFMEIRFCRSVHICIKRQEPLTYRDEEVARLLSNLKDSLQEAKTFTEWQAIASEIDKHSGTMTWASSSCSDLYDYELLQANVSNLHKASISGNVRDLIFVLPGSLQRSFCGISHERLFEHRLLGTKFEIENFISELGRCIDTVRLSDELTSSEKLTFFESAGLSIGHTALCLSGGGSLSMYHMGVVKSLLDNSLLPKYISGTSGGSIVCAMVGMYSDQELLNDVIANDIASRYGLSWFEPLATQMINFATRGVLMENGFFARTCEAYYRDVTFAEAYLKTGRAITITLTKTTRGERDLDVDVVLLNYVTSPDVLLRSAVEASCALPGLMHPVELLAKDSQGFIKKYYPDGVRFVDGSITADVPMKRLTQLFNTSHFIVSQVNPHIAPFACRNKCSDSSWRYGPLQRLARLVVNDLQSSARKLAKLRLIPNIFGYDVSAVLTQKYQGDITIFPRMGLLDTLNVLSHPSEQDMSRYISEGERATWPLIPRMRQALKIELHVRRVLTELRNEANDSNSAARVATSNGLCRTCSHGQLNLSRIQSPA